MKNKSFPNFPIPYFPVFDQDTEIYSHLPLLMKGAPQISKMESYVTTVNNLSR